MSGGSLSQGEIDALLSGDAQADGEPATEAEAAAGAEPEQAPAPEAEAAAPAPEEAAGDRAPLETAVDLTAPERDTIGEVGNICMSSAATALSALLGYQVQITTPSVDVVTGQQVRDSLTAPAAMVVIEYTSGLDGRNVLVMTTRDASVIADLLLGGEGTAADELSELHASAIGESMNQMMGSAATAMAEMIGRRVDISAPTVEVPGPGEESSLGGLANEDPIVRVAFQLRVGELLDSTLMQLMPIAFARTLVDGLHDTVGPAAEPVPAEAPPAAPEAAPAADLRSADLLDALAEAPPAPAPGDDDRRLKAVPAPVAQPVAFPSLDEAPPAPGGSDISLLLDVPLQVTVELGRTQLRIRNVLELVPGSIVELDKLAGEPVDVLVNGKQIARGEVVVIDEEFGVRITDVASQAKRLRGLATDEA
jgi:flagellar motor switch protein FliN/FliY